MNKLEYLTVPCQHPDGYIYQAALRIKKKGREWAVTKSHPQCWSDWTVTHIQSGKAARFCIFYKDAVEAFRMFEKEMPIWDGQGEMPEDFGKKGAEIRDRLMS